MASQDNKLQRAYERMVDMVADLVDVEGKTLKEALEVARHKLSEWESLTREEVDKIADEVAKDVRSFSQALTEVRDAVQEKLAIDSIYVTESVLKMLSKIADRTTVELASFTEELKARARASTEEAHEQAHREHRQFESEHALWLDEIEIWQREHEQAESRLMAIQEAIRQHGEALQAHAQAIRAHQARDHEHEVDMAQYERDPDNEQVSEKDLDDDLMHHEMTQEHRKQAQWHQQLKQHHHEVMALIEKLYKKSVSTST